TWSRSRGLISRPRPSWRKDSPPSGSRLRLDGLQVDEDAPEHLVAQDALPDGHPLVEAPLAHRFAEYLGRLPPVTERQSTQVERPLSLNRVRPVAMGAVLVEQAPAIRDRVGGTLLGRDPRGPGGTEGGGCERRDAQRNAEPRQLPSSNTTRTPPSGLASMTFCAILPRNDGGPFTRPATTARYCVPSTA